MIVRILYIIDKGVLLMISIINTRKDVLNKYGESIDSPIVRVSCTKIVDGILGVFKLKRKNKRKEISIYLESPIKY